MAIEPMELKQGQRVIWRNQITRVLYLNRYWTRAGAWDVLVGGDVWIEGRSLKHTPLELIEFCKVARKPPKVKRATPAWVKRWRASR